MRSNLKRGISFALRGTEQRKSFDEFRLNHWKRTRPVGTLRRILSFFRR